MNEKSLIIGAAFVDVIMNVPNLPGSGGDVTAETPSYNVGGCAFNVYGAIRYQLGKEAADLFVPVGKGQYSKIVQEDLKKARIPMLLKKEETDNGWDLCLVEPSGERSFITVPGIEQRWKSDWFNAIQLNNYKYFYLSGYEAENLTSSKVILDTLKGRRSDSYILFDASPRISHIPKTTIKQLLTNNVIINANEDEISYLSTKKDLESQTREIYKQTHSPVIVTLGSKGTYLFNDGVGKLIPGEKVKVVNTIGAGDTHCGGVLAGLQNGMNIEDAIKLGNHLSAKVIQQDAGSLLN